MRQSFSLTPNRRRAATFGAAAGTAHRATAWTACLAAAAAMFAAPPGAGRAQVAAARAPAVTWNFETGDLRGWRATGTAFASQPTRDDNPTARRRGQPSGHEGSFWIGTYERFQGRRGQTRGDVQGDEPTGTLTSPTFTIPSSLSFLVGGGSSADTRVDLWVEGSGEFPTLFRSASGADSETMRRVTWDLSEVAGRMGYLQVVDHSSSGWGHINVDDFQLGPSGRLPDRSVLDALRDRIRPDHAPEPARPDGGRDDVIPPDPVPQDTTPALVPVPDARGRPHRAAVALLDSAGLKPAPPEFRDAFRPDGTVLDQAPDPGTPVRPGTAVLLVVARSVPVPDLRNRPVEAAEGSLAGLRLGDITPVASDAAPGLVIDQRPAAGSFVPRGTAVDVAVADDLVAVPQLRGLDEREARAAIERGFLAVGNAGRALASDGSGTVVRQSPPAGASVPAGTPVGFLIADRGVDVPDLTGRALAEARDALRRAELSLRAVDSVASERPTGSVLAQRPAAGALVVPGTGVVVDVAAGVPVPSLVGAGHEEARSSLENVGLVADSAERVPSERRPGTVIRQAPLPGTVVPLGTAVAIAVARGVTVPDLGAADSAGAGRTLAGVPLRVGRIATRPAAAPPGTVVGQDPAPGVEVAPGAPVDLVLSRWIAVPAFVGRDTADAPALAADSLTAVLDPRWRLRGSAAVLEQEPAAGDTVPPGSSIRLTVARPIPPLVLGTAGLLLLGAGGLVVRRARRPGGGAARAGRNPVPVPVPVPPLSTPRARPAPQGRTREVEPPGESGRTQPELRAVPDRMPRLRTSRDPSAGWEFRWRPVFDEGELTMAIPGTLIANRVQVPDAAPVATEDRHDERVPLDARRST